ncbi:MAG TPA: multicopper oxidase domain-containing protein [Acidimicrobiia bacterium]|nr:multicopper oxidase domain-containing protein [Acidimicrobiia bacterium]
MGDTVLSGPEVLMDAPHTPPPAQPVVEVSITRLATSIFSVLALLFALGALVMASDTYSSGQKATQAGAVAPAANTSSVLEGTAIPATAVAVSLTEFAINPKMVMVGKDGVIKVTNAGAIQHTLTVEGKGPETPTLDPKGVAGLSLKGLPSGSYTLSCTIPGHKAAGMTADLQVMDGESAGSAGAGNGDAMSADEMDEMTAGPTKAFLAGAKTAGVGAQLLAPKVLGDGTKEFDLTAKIVDWEIEPGKIVKAWTYNGTTPGPTLKVNIGDKVKIVLHNELPESTSIHFHGLMTPNSMDGVPDITQAPVKPGQSFTYEFTAKGPAVGMYHSHQDAVKQVPNGLAGMFLIGQEPVPTGVTISQEIPMMLNDAGTIGLSLNGKSFPATAPVIAKTGDYVLVHYMNEGVMAHPMHLHGLPQTVIAKDGMPLAQPYDADTILVGPGERYSVLVHATEPGAWAWHCHILTHAESDKGMFGMVTAMVVK